MLSDIDKLYLDKLREKGSLFTMQQLQGMVDSARDMYSVQVREKNPELTERTGYRRSPPSVCCRSGSACHD